MGTEQTEIPIPKVGDRFVNRVRTELECEIIRIEDPGTVYNVKVYYKFRQDYNHVQGKLPDTGVKYLTDFVKYWDPLGI